MTSAVVISVLSHLAVGCSVAFVVTDARMAVGVPVAESCLGAGASPSAFIFCVEGTDVVLVEVALGHLLVHVLYKFVKV